MTSSIGIEIDHYKPSTGDLMAQSLFLVAQLLALRLVD